MNLIKINRVRAITTILMFLSLACNSVSDKHDENIIGTWEYIDGNQYVFKSSGDVIEKENYSGFVNPETGVQEMVTDQIEGKWSTSDSSLNLKYHFSSEDDGIKETEWDDSTNSYAIDNDCLYIGALIKSDGDQTLAGTYKAVWSGTSGYSDKAQGYAESYEETDTERVTIILNKNGRFTRTLEDSESATIDGQAYDDITEVTTLKGTYHTEANVIWGIYTSVEGANSEFFPIDNKEHIIAYIINSTALVSTDALELDDQPITNYCYHKI